MGNQNYIVAAEADSTGALKFYTGRAGEGYVSSNKSESFVYGSLEAATSRCENLNRMSPLTNLTFHPVAKRLTYGDMEQLAESSYCRMLVDDMIKKYSREGEVSELFVKIFNHHNNGVTGAND